jgi:hypothetical protein
MATSLSLSRAPTPSATRHVPRSQTPSRGEAFRARQNDPAPVGDRNKDRILAAAGFCYINAPAQRAGGAADEWSVGGRAVEDGDRAGVNLIFASFVYDGDGGRGGRRPMPRRPRASLRRMENSPIMSRV